MKTNLWKLSCMALAMAAIATGCNQNNELGTPAPSGEEDVLNVVATANDFVSSDPTSRITDTNYTTTFGEGDAIGVFVVRDGEALVSNMKMTLGADETTWAGENGAKLYYYKDADYIAYSPYTEGLSVTSEDEIISHFTAKLGTTGQSTLADYQAADLMTASVKAADVQRGQDISFSFAHKMSMIEIKVPIRAYTTTTGDYEYSAPLGLKVKIGDQDNFSLCTFGKETTGETGSEVTKGIYRCIVAPNTELNVEGEFQDGPAPVYFPASGGTALSVTPKVGEYNGIDVDYDYQNYDATRDLKVGDYYYADGSIWPNELGKAPKTGCVGIIFSIETSAIDKNTHSWKNGYVIALENTSGTLGTDYSQWASSSDVTLSGNTLANGGDLTDMDGYTASYSEALSEITAVAAAKAYSVALPENTSGWYLPSAAQLATVLNNLYTNDGWSFNEVNAYSTKDEDKLVKIEALKAIQKKFEDVGGYLLNAQESEFGTNVSPAKTDRWWSTTEVDGQLTKAWALELKSNGQVSLIVRDKNSSSGGQASVRPVFAF